MLPTGEYVPHYLRPGHYIVKNKEHGCECLRCGSKGVISDIKAKECTNPHGEPVYPEEAEEKKGEKKAEEMKIEETKGEEKKAEEKTVTCDPPGHSAPWNPVEAELAHLKALEHEYESLKALEHQLDMINQMQQEQEHLEALEHEQLMLEMKGVVGSDQEVEKECTAYWERHNANMEAKLVKIKIPQEIAKWAVEKSNGEWEKAMNMAYKRVQEQEEQKIKNEEDAKKDTKGKKRRPPASPCASRKPRTDTTEPPPGVSKKIEAPCTIAAPMDI